MFLHRCNKSNFYEKRVLPALGGFHEPNHKFSPNYEILSKLRDKVLTLLLF